MALDFSVELEFDLNDLVFGWIAPVTATLFFY